MTRTGQVILAKNIRLDKSYRNVLDYSEGSMVNLVRGNAVLTGSNFQFLRPDVNVISTSWRYDDCLKGNYLAFQNPNYSNKWFFAFIDSVEYVSDGVTRLHYIIDEWSTWWSYWHQSRCFVVREHVSDDSRGSNTVPEGLETGEYVNDNRHILIDECKYFTNIFKNYSPKGTTHLCICSSYMPTSESEGYNIYGYNQFGMFGGYGYIMCQDVSSARKCLEWLDKQSKKDAVQGIFYMPDWVTVANEYDWPSRGFVVPEAYDSITTVYANVSVPNTIDGYTPKNNKVLCYPYQYLQLTNNAGGVANYKYEDVSGRPSEVTLFMDGTMSISGSIKCYLANYRESTSNYDNGLTGFKFPVCSWASDVFTNWLTQNSVNLALSSASSLIQIAGGIGLSMTGAGSVAGASQIGSGILSIASNLGSIYSHELEPNQVRGNVNSGDVAFSSYNYNIMYSKMHIKAEYAKIIDEYFSEFGYKINRVKLPNFASRTVWNYVQIGSQEIGAINIETTDCTPADSLAIINKILQSGTTIWHDHANIGNYNLDNNIK